jgi:hypothetical protein
VEWICTDSKKRFIPHLKATVNLVGGVESNVAVTMTKGHEQALDTLLSLPATLAPHTSMVVFDPITRVLDMSRTDPILWGRVLIEEALPTLGALASERGLDVILVSEMRFLPEVGNSPVYSTEISKWTDNTVKVCRDISGKTSSIFIVENGNDREIAHLQVLRNGACQLSISRHQEVVTNCLEREF